MPRLANAISLILFSVNLLSTAPTPARDIFVNNHLGDDSFNGQVPAPDTTRSGPVRSIGRALQLVNKGDRIVVANTGKPYYESVSLSTGAHSGLDRMPFEIVAEGVVLDGTRPVPFDAWRAVEANVFQFDTEKFGSQRLFLDNKPAKFRQPPVELTDNVVDTSLTEARIRAKALSDFLKTLKPLEWTAIHQDIYFRTNDGWFPEQYDLRYAFLQTGVTLYQVESVKISGLTVHGFRLDGINAHDTVRRAELVDINARACGRSGVTVAGASRLNLRDSFLFDNSDSQLRTEDFSITRLENTEANPSSAPAFARHGGRLFVDGELQPPESR